jgi:hypothetical protein
MIMGQTHPNAHLKQQIAANIQYFGEITSALKAGSFVFYHSMHAPLYAFYQTIF